LVINDLPEAGDLVRVNFDPQAGREQAKNRPALVITGSDFNAATGLLVVCPITRTDRPWRTRVPQPLFDDVKSRIATMLDL
jgi:mRNA interferase MazF